MAVLEHEVHERTKIGADWHPGCWNRPRTRKPYPVKNGYRMIDEGNGTFASEQLWKLIPSVNSLECRSDAPECVGCDHYNPKYVQMVKRLGS